MATRNETVFLKTWLSHPFDALTFKIFTAQCLWPEAMEDNMTLGFQTLSSILALQLRHALRRWENFARRKQFEERQSKVVHALRRSFW